ncbi:MAG: hypothetical protein ACE14P_00245 [Methanotrichaceae archaeon]
MANRLEKESYVLHTEGIRLEPISLDRNLVGFCTRCNSELESLAYHKSEDSWLVSAACKNEHLVLMRYDNEWKWLDDQSLEISARMPKKPDGISTLPREKLEAVFTPAEIRDMTAYELGKPYIRQNLYRARAKFERFEKLFGIKIKL